MVEAQADAIITEEVLVDLAAEEVLEENAEALVAEVLGQEKKVDLEAIEMQLQKKAVSEAQAVLPTDQEERVVSIAIVLQEKHQVHFKEKETLQDVLKVRLINQEKEDQEEVNSIC